MIDSRQFFLGLDQFHRGVNQQFLDLEPELQFLFFFVFCILCSACQGCREKYEAVSAMLEIRGLSVVFSRNEDFPILGHFSASNSNHINPKEPDVGGACVAAPE